MNAVAKPTKLLCPPHYVRTTGRRGGSVVIWFTCDNGVCYTALALAEELGFRARRRGARSALVQRIDRGMAWDDPRLFAPPAPKGERVAGGGLTQGTIRGEYGTAEWQALGDTPRNLALLAKIKLGSCERERAVVCVGEGR